ncbi:MAG TPA: hypothetical protein VEH29_16660 [Acidimicrobiales bacterium]|nr:hypothetical protein [Acidimicrobiales bacterium]
MSTTRVNYEESLEEVEHALSKALGPAYTVTAISPSTLRVKRNNVITATVRLSWSDEGTTFRVRGGGLIVSRVIDSFTVTPKVRHALERSFVSAA